MSRRRWLKQMASVPFASLVAGGAAGCSDEPSVALNATFSHGVASGDPLHDSVIVWTRVTTDEAEVEVRWTMSTTPEMDDVVGQGVVSTNGLRDFTVKVDATGLSAATTYYYRFEFGGVQSPIGRTRTTPLGEDVDRLRLAVMSCANYAAGHFHAYRRVATLADLDGVVFLGDYIYEYGVGRYPDERVVDPPHEIVSLDDYRRRYRLNRADPDLAEVHRQHPFFCVWDDHEITNNAWREGADNHDASEGDFAERLAVAYQAYSEYLPFRESADGTLYRHFEFGSLAELMMLDTRIFGRDEQLGPGGMSDPTRELLGVQQQAWLDGRLAESGARWKLLGQQVILGHVSSSVGFYDARNPDQWDGYPEARARLFESMARAEDVVVLTGDWHSSWAMDLTPDPFDASVYDASTRRGSIGVEFVTTSVSSPSLYGGDIPQREADFIAGNPHLQYVDLTPGGWTVVDIDRERVQVDFYTLDGEGLGRGVAQHRASFEVLSGQPFVQAIEGPSEGVADPPLLAP